jgi:dipeptidyl aminopeptidase/acylaminoacyl peptidase
LKFIQDYCLSDVRNAVFGGVLTKDGSEGGYSYSGNLTNYVTGIHNVTYAESPLDLGGEDDYDLSPDGTRGAFLTKDVNLPLANYTSSQVYLVPFAGTADDAVPINPRGSATYPETQGASANPRFSPDSTKIAWTQMNGIYYESDRSMLYTAGVDGGPSFNVTRLAGEWDRSPSVPLWSQDGETIFVDAADLGRVRLFTVPITAGNDYKPENITDEGAVAAFHLLPDGKILVSDSKIWTSRDIYTVSADGSETRYLFQANKVDEELAGLGPEDVSEFYYSTNTSEIKQQAWVIYPEGFDETQKYPLAYIIHGGPQGAHANSWSTRWNFKVWADQGYVSIFTLCPRGCFLFNKNDMEGGYQRGLKEGDECLGCNADKKT